MGFMMKKTIIALIFLVAVAGVIGVSAFNKNSEEVVGYLDGQPVKTAELQAYVDTLLAKSYEKKMDTKEGRQELFNHYINRKLLLEYAKENVKNDDSFVVSHTMGDVNSDTALLSAVLKNEINEKITYTETEVRELGYTEPQFKDLEAAERELISRKRIALFNKLMDEIKSKHQISVAG